MNFMEGINFYAVIVSTIVYYFIGFIWYSVLFGKLWAKETGVIMPDSPKPKVFPLVGQFVSTFLYVAGVAIILNLHGSYGIREGLHVALLVSVFFIIPMNSGNLFFTGKRKLFLIDVSERILGTLVTGIILGVWH